LFPQGTFLKKPIFILGSHKSGTSLLRSLFDGAEGLFVIPTEIHFFQYAGFWVDYALRPARPQELTFEQWIQTLVQHVEHVNTEAFAVGATGDNILPGRWDVSALSDYLRARADRYFEEKNYLGLLNSYVEALHVSLYGKPPVAQRFVEKSVEQAEYAELIHKLYPDAKFLHVVRNPYATLVAIRRHMSQKNRYPFLNKAINALENSYYYLYKNPLLINDYLILRYEDLVNKPNDTMQRVAEFVEIEFGDVLLTPTTLGVPWTGNSTSGRVFEGISKQPLDAWRDKITSLEIRLVNLLFKHVLRDYGYTQISERDNVFKPSPGENVKTYLANRFLLEVISKTRCENMAGVY
jgi:protein-tyrosine sulfotransferase